MVVAEILGVANDVVAEPPVNTPPPIGAAYQSTVSPALTVAEIVTEPFPQREFGTAVGAVGNGLTLAVVVAAALVHPSTVTVTE